MTIMHTILHILGAVMIVLGGLLLADSAWGVHVLHDALSRQHAATKACMIAISTLCVGAFLMQPHWAWGWRLGAVSLYLMMTLPISAPMLARAAVTEMDPGRQRQ